MSFFTRKRAAFIVGCFVLLLHFSFTGIGQVRMRANLMIVDNNGKTLMDANMTNYGTYSNNVDGSDIWKLSNFSENFGILRQNANLVIERRSVINETDTTYFRMWNMQQRHYNIQVIAENLYQNNLIGFVRDYYLNQDTPINLNDTTYVDFYVTSVAGSYAQNRFSLIYISNSAALLPVTFTGIKAVRENFKVLIQWESRNEISLDHYVVERSYDGNRFSDIETVKASNTPGNKFYQAADVLYTEVNVYYRVKALSISGKVEYSSIVRVTNVSSDRSALTVYPNPVINKQLHLQIDTPADGIYQVSLIQMNGQVLPLAEIYKKAGVSTESINLPHSLPAGNYQLRIGIKGEKTQTRSIVIH